MKLIAIILLSFVYSTVTDIDGNIYETIQIGNQIWMAENLKVTHYNDGTSIPTGLSGLAWSNLSTGAYAVYNNDESNADTYGYLYNGYAVGTGNLAPEGWRVPTDEEWIELTDYLGSNAGSQLAGNYDLWTNLYPAADLVNNEAFGTSGFDGLPSGYRNDGDGWYGFMGDFACFWSFTENSNNNAFTHSLKYHDSAVSRHYNQKKNGFAVRLVRDVIEGCMDPYSLNYDETADVDDGTCYYPQNGDLTFNGSIDVGDIVLMVEYILEESELNDIQFQVADLNISGHINVTDVVMLIELILSN